MLLAAIGSAQGHVYSGNLILRLLHGDGMAPGVPGGKVSTPVAEDIG